MKEKILSEVDFLLIRSFYWFLQECEANIPNQRTDVIINKLQIILQNNKQFGSVELKNRDNCKRLVGLLQCVMITPSQRKLI